ncbi:dnaK family protein [Babesia divergens]|uniref:DnaK family protein n=1 Tax=Babesia divergens TaxID=32595 RepID=A0AAD9LEK7_BABDI|nr:dnaK family protein [Babesia divergens]
MPVLGIDIGDGSATVATIAKGAIDIVLNDVSQRYTPVCASFTQKRRLFGDQATPQMISNYRNSCRNMISLLGRTVGGQSDLAVTPLDDFFSPNGLSACANGHVGYNCAMETDPYEVTKVLAGYLSFLSEMADKYTGAPCRDVVLACPSWFSEIQREALKVSAQAAGLSCLNVIDECTAMVLDYGVYRVKQLSDEKPTTVALVMIGHSHASAAICDFYQNHAEILAQVSSRDIGGRNLDQMLMKHMAHGFEKKYGCNPLENRKIRSKLEAVAIKTKRVLSANNESGFSAECLMEDNDLQGNITREEFEELCKQEFLPDLTEMLMECVNMFGKSVEEIAAVEIAGGATRIPCVQKTISSVFGSQLSRTLNSDECVARGCVLDAAMRSISYRVRKYRVVERITRPLTFAWVQGGDMSKLTSAEVVEVLPAGSSKAAEIAAKLPISAPVTIVASLGDPRDPADPHFLNAIDITKQLAPTETEGVVTVAAIYDENGKFAFSGVEGHEFVVLPRNPIFNVQAYADFEREARQKDTIENERLRTLNDFETMLYSVKEKMSGSHRDYVAPELVGTITAELDKWTSWLYDNYEATLEVLQDALQRVSADWNPIERLYFEQQAKENDLDAFVADVHSRYNLCCEDGPMWYGAPAEERMEFAQKLQVFEEKYACKLRRRREELATWSPSSRWSSSLTSEIDEFCRRMRVQSERRRAEEAKAQEEAAKANVEATAEGTQDPAEPVVEEAEEQAVTE